MAATTDPLHPVFRERLRRALADHPGAYILSAGRSSARQAQLYQDYLAGRGNPANPPGTSWHEFDDSVPHPNATAGHAERSGLRGGPWAMAVDLAGSYGAIHRNPGRYGLCAPIRSEDWHFQPEEIRESARVAGAWRRLPAPGPAPQPTPADPFNAQGRTVLHFHGE